VIEVHRVPLEEACRWALDGTITDAKTVIGLLRARYGAPPVRGTEVAGIP